MQQVDARLNEWQGALDAINGLTLTDARTAINTLNSSGSVTLDIVGKATLVVHLNVTVAFNAATNVVIEGSVDGTNFFTVPIFIIQSPATGASPTGGVPESTAMSIPGSSPIGQYLVCCSATGFRTMRARMTFTTAGTAVVAMRATQAEYRIISQPQPSILTVTGTGTSASTTSAFLTLPAPGAGLSAGTAPCPGTVRAVSFTPSDMLIRGGMR